MGNRKERRRLAAQSNSGRRVKLDLFAEPSGGDLGGSAEHGGVGGDVHTKPKSGLLNSPSSSGQQPENPLLLLGQYSDEEFDDGSDNIHRDNIHSDTAVDTSSSPNHDEVKKALDESGQNLDTKGGEETASEKFSQNGVVTNSDSVNHDQSMEIGDKRENGALDSRDLHTEVVLAEKGSLPETSNAQVIGDVSSGWKIVMHEESNNYYYWNTETGETSWEVPDILAQATKSQEMPSVDGNKEKVPVGTQQCNDYSYPQVTEESVNMVPQGTELSGDGSQMNEWNIAFHNGSETGPSQLVKYSEALLERLRSLQGSKDQLQGFDWTTKYILEVEIRLFDLKSLLSYGSSLLPFWVHSEVRLKWLESAINDEMSKNVYSRESNEVEASHAPFALGVNSYPESIGRQSEADPVENKQMISSLDGCNSTIGGDAVAEDLEVRDSSVKYEHAFTYGLPIGHTEGGASDQVHGVVVPDESTTKNEVCAEEDVDMDVDMEVEDSNADGNTTTAHVANAKEFTVTEQPNQPSPPCDVGEVFAVAPPPDEEWIPPPPPDNEEVPPPPPDEPPPEPPYPPLQSYPEMGQPSYTEHYNFTYPVSSFGYYGLTVGEVPGGNYYGHAEQVAIPHLPVYYGAVPSTYAETSQVVANPVEPVTYYGLQDGTGLAPPGVSSVDSLLFCTEVARPSSDNLGSDHPSATVEIPSASATVEAPPSIGAKDNISAPLIDSDATGAPAPVTSVVAKVQPKVLRTKKKAVPAASSLRSNKKVSSLVDKWKAAKEELLEDEEEPEDAYELLEKKRKREIEEWYAQHIASGEARDNANFQPLGGNWREKVKRRKAQLAREAVQTASEAHSNGNQQPDLKELSKDLPTGWQVYWDESSKQVYYGNIVTSETTWTRPTK